jgi:hypothetical protein
MDDRAILGEKLAFTLHLNVIERECFKEAPLRRSEVVAVVQEVLVRDGFFPPQANPSRHHGVVWEGHFLQLLSDGTVRLGWQRSAPAQPMLVAERHFVDFSSMHQAVEELVTREWKNGIDGIPLS